MGPRRRLSVLAVAVVGLTTAVALVACKRKEDAPPTPPAPTASAKDHLAKDEIPEGRDHAYTLPLPLHSTVKARFPGSVHVASSHSREELANFTRARVKDGKSSAGASETRFENVTVTSDPSRVLTIEIRTAPIAGEFRSQMVVNDVTPPPADPNLTDADRWRKAGLTPDGKLLDPKHLQ